MIILQHGMPGLSTKGIVICRKCGCIYQFDKDDVKHTFDRYDHYDYVSCPTCNNVYEWQVRPPEQKV